MTGAIEEGEQENMREGTGYFTCAVPTSSCKHFKLFSSFFPSVNKMSHILRLADEYQADGVHDLCGKALRDVPKSQSNALEIFLLTTQTATAREDERLDLVRSQCKGIVKNMDLVTIRGSSDFQNLDRDACESLLGERIVRLETFVSQIYPQFIGLIEYCLHLGLECALPGLTCCPVHFPGGTHKVNTGLPRRIGDCSVCKQMIKQMVNSSRTSRKSKVPYAAPKIRSGFGGMRDESTPDASQEHVYGGDHRFDGEVISIVNDFTQIRSYKHLKGTKAPGFGENIRFQVPKKEAPSGFTFGFASSTGPSYFNPR